MSNVNKLVDRLTDRIPYLLLKTSKLLSLYTSKRKTSQGMVKKVCRYNGQLVQVQWTFGQNHEIILSTVLAFDCIQKLMTRVIQAPFLNMYFGILEFSFGHQKTVTWVFGCTELFSEVESTKILVFGTVTVPNFFSPRLSALILRCFID